MPISGFKAHFYACVISLCALVEAVALADWKDQFPDAGSSELEVGETYRVDVLALRPTQFTAGILEAELRSKKLEDMSKRERRGYLERKAGRAILGPNHELWLIDGHHVALAVHMAGFRKMLVSIEYDWSNYSNQAFLDRMRRFNKFFLYENGKGPLDPRRLPRSVLGLRNDPYRTLAWRVQKAGGFRETSAPFAEFKWADFFRNRIPLREVNRAPKRSLTQALQLASSADAQHLPGYIKRKRSQACEMLLR